MPPLSDDEAMELARQYRDWAKAVGDAMLGPTAGANEQDRLRKLHTQLIDASVGYAAKGVAIACDNVAPHVDAIREATKRLERAIRQAQSVASLIDGAAKAVTLAGAIASGNASAIASAARAIV